MKALLSVACAVFFITALALGAMTSAGAVILGAIDIGDLDRSSDAVVAGRLVSAKTAADGHDVSLDVAVDRVLSGEALPGQVIRVAIRDGASTDRLRVGGYALFFLSGGVQGRRLDNGDGSVVQAAFRKPVDAHGATVDERVASELVSTLVSDDSTLASSYGAGQLALQDQHAVVGLMRREVVSELVTLPAAVTKPRILDAAAAAPQDLGVQLACAAALVRARDASLITAVIPALLHVDPRHADAVRDLARWYRLGDWDTSQMTTAKALLGSDDADVSSAAALVLAKIEARRTSMRPADGVAQFPMQHKSSN